MTLSLEALVLNGDGENVGAVTYRKLSAVLRWRRVGAWALTISQLTDSAWDLTVPGAALLVRSGTGTVFSGPVDGARLKADTGTPGGLITVQGWTDEIHLADRLAWPVPAAAPDDQTADSHDRREGQASAVLIAYAGANAGPSARPERQVSGLSLAGDPSIGPVVSGAARFDNLLDLLEELAVAGGDIGFDVRRTLTGGPSFRVYQPRDLRAPGRFSFELGNVVDLDWSLDAPTATIVIGGGQGDLTARTFVYADDPASALRWRRRIESFHDARAEGEPDKLQQDVTTKLAKAGETAAARITPLDSPSLRYGIDYGLGDRITAEAAPGRIVQGVIREVEISDDAKDGVRYQPRLGDPGATATDAGTVALTGAQRDVRALQTSK